MSLLFGLWAPDSSREEPDDLTRCAAALGRYRGIGRPRQFADGHCFLAHGQGIVTPEDRFEQQPSLHGGDRFVLALDGFLANRDELIDLLSPTTPAGLADSGLAAAALLRWGDLALERMHGDFAFAWWDRAERRLLLACDRVGGRTLFYHTTGRRLFCANLIGNLFVHPAVPRVLDPEMVARTAVMSGFDPERTCFRDIGQLPAGHKLVWTPTHTEVSRYWRLESRRRIRLSRDEEYVEAARELLDRVVGDAMRAEGPAVAMLSGGLDSGGVAATAARLIAPAELHTVTIRPDPSCAQPPCPQYTFFDEWPHAQAAASWHPNIIAHAEHATQDSVEDTLRAHMALTGRPAIHLMAATWHAATWRLSRSLGAKVVLSGISGNATLSASARPRALHPGPADLPNAIADAVGNAAGGHGLTRLKTLSKWLLSSGRTRPPRNPLTAEAAALVNVEAIYNAYMTGDRERPWRARERVALQEQIWMSRSVMASLSLRYQCEARDPLGDVRLAEFCLAIPADQFTRGPHDRFLARRVLADRLPPQVTKERRSGRQAPEWFDRLSRDRTWLAAELDAIETSALGRELIDVPRLRAILDDWPENAAAAEARAYPLRAVLGRGVALGSFIRWAEGNNR